MRLSNYLIGFGLSLVLHGVVLAWMITRPAPPPPVPPAPATPVEIASLDPENKLPLDDAEEPLPEPPPAETKPPAPAEVPVHEPAPAQPIDEALALAEETPVEPTSEPPAPTPMDTPPATPAVEAAADVPAVAAVAPPPPAAEPSLEVVPADPFDEMLVAETAEYEPPPDPMVAPPAVVPADPRDLLPPPPPEPVGTVEAETAPVEPHPEPVREVARAETPAPERVETPKAAPPRQETPSAPRTLAQSSTPAPRPTPPAQRTQPASRPEPPPSRPAPPPVKSPAESERQAVSAATGDEDFVPPLRVHWRDAAELRAVARALGMRLAAVNREGAILAEIDLSPRARLKSWRGLPYGYSNRVRVLSPAIFRPRLDSHNGQPIHEVWVFVPADRDRAMVTAQAAAMRRSGVDPDEVLYVDGCFVRTGGDYRLDVTRIRTRPERSARDG